MAAASNSSTYLDESWASLDVAEFVRDEDLQSENTDHGSLVDLQSTNESESVVDEEEDDLAAAGYEQEDSAEESAINSNSIVEGYSVPANDEEDESLYFDESILQLHSPFIDLSISKQAKPVGDPSLLSHVVAKFGPEAKLYETIMMTVSTKCVDTEGSPFGVGYFGTASAQAEQEVIMKKIGGVLVSCTGTLDSSTSSNHATYHLVPTHFDMAMKPTFAELIRSQARMTVNELCVLEAASAANNNHKVELALKDGTPVVAGRISAREGQQGWRPDLILVHIDAIDLVDERDQVGQVIRFAQNHNIPFIVIAEGAVGNTVYVPEEYSLQRVLEMKDGPYSEGIVARSPLCIDEFLRLDAEQLNRHLRFLVDRVALQSQNDTSTLDSMISTWSNIKKLFNLSSYHNNTSESQDDLPPQSEKARGGTSTEPPVIKYARILNFCENAQLWPLFWTSIIMLLGMIVLGLGLALTSYSPLPKSIDGGTPWLINKHCTHKEALASTSIVPAKIATAKAVAPKIIDEHVQQNPFPYIPAIPVLQTPKALQGSSEKVESDKEEHSVIGQAGLDQYSLSKLKSKATEVERVLRLKLSAAQDRLYSDPIIQQKFQLCKQYLTVLDQLQAEMRSTVDNIGSNTQVVYQRTRKQLSDVLTHHGALWTHSLEVTEEQLREMIREQKDLLKVAQKNAKKILQQAHGHEGGIFRRK